MTVTPALTVLMPYRNAADTLDACLHSIRKQGFTAFELLAIDDHSTDASTARIEAFAEPRFRVLANPGKGIVDALNHGLQCARSSLIVRMDADDLMRENRLAEQYAFMQQHPEISLSASCVALFPAEKIQNGYAEYVRWQNACLSERQIANQIYVESPFAHPAVVFRREAVVELGGYRNGPFAEDYELWLRLFHAGKRMVKLDRVLLDWRESDTRLSRTSSRYSRQAFDRLRADYLSRDGRLADRTIVYWGAGRKTRKRIRHLVEKGFPAAAWIDIDPKKIGQTIDGAPVHPPAWLYDSQTRFDGRRPMVLIYVTNHGAREWCERFLLANGYRAGEDFLAVG